jgi:hypothetical protein
MQKLLAHLRGFLDASLEQYKRMVKAEDDIT